MASITASFVAWAPRLLSVLRIVTGFLMIQHGTSKLFGIPHIAMFDNLRVFSLIGLAGVLELVLGALVLIGLFTRTASFVLSGEMAFAYFIGHAPRGFLPILNQGELAVLYCFVFLYLSAAGAGPWSVDAALAGRSAADERRPDPRRPKADSPVRRF